MTRRDVENRIARGRHRAQGAPHRCYYVGTCDYWVDCVTWDLWQEGTTVIRELPVMVTSPEWAALLGVK